MKHGITVTLQQITWTEYCNYSSKYPARMRFVV